ncbi:unnamed protein product [Parnassius mnemosyne]|uniref:unspecific monooxygenase n=1 Tax=Parnassius mnemosyne TaxID=213953 RepID=A0AAV1M1M2_9NEOP
MLIPALLLLTVLVLTFSHYFGKYNESYWKQRGVAFYSRNKIIGPLWDFIFGKQAFFEILADIYKKYPDAPVVGVGSVSAPTVLVRDATNIRYILQVDFESFYHRGLEVQPGDRLADSVPFLNGKRWKLIRQNLTPLFSLVKLKTMYSVMDKSAQDFVKYLNDHPEKLKGNAFETLSTFCSAAISASIFGITTESIFDSPFLRMAQNAVVPTFWSNLRFSLLLISPWLFRKLKLALFAEHETFFINAVKQLIRQREKEGVKQYDFADLCVNLQKKGDMKDGETGLSIEPTDELMAAQAFFFFIAGVEPSALALYCTLIELGRNPDVLKRVHDEIDDIFKKYNNTLTYESLSDAKYLEMVLNEGLRLYPPLGILGRQCVKDSVLPVGNIKIEKGTKILLSPFEVHRDPKFFPEPDKFIPERFANESKAMTDHVYMAFGKGSRVCIGERFARIQITTGFIYLLRYFTVKTHVEGGEIKYKKEQFQVRPSNAALEFIPRNIKNAN